MLRIGNLQIASPFYQAGLAGYSDAAMRLVARRHGAPYAMTEAMLDQFLIAGGKAVKAAELDDEDHPIGGQLMGSDPAEMAQAATILVRLGYDVIDVNLACPVKKIRRKCRGGHLLQNPEQALAILDAVRQAVPAALPCSVKLRRGSDDSALALANFHRIFQGVCKLGYAATTVHGRSVEQKYLGPSRWQFLTELVATYGHEGTQIFGSGDIWNAQDIFAMIRQTGVRAVSVARGCIGNPWIFAQAQAIARGDEQAGSLPPTIAQQRQVLLEHFSLSVRCHGEKSAGMMMRKFGIKFARHHPESAAVAKAFIAVQSLIDWRAVVDSFYGELAAAVAQEPAYGSGAPAA